ncbi:unnamed protein product [Durusdinium trenchii]|uniref:Glycosyl transferase family 25 domain-containing protein n=1 Tax=Durusdinium trenchii TaxID=1381693 RepID=A0ABP0S4R0_9DINO
MKPIGYFVLYVSAGFVGFLLPELTEKGTAKRCVLPSLSELTSRREENATASETTTAAPKASAPRSGEFLERVPEEEVRLQLPHPFACDPFEHVIAISLEDDRGKPGREALVAEFEKAGIQNYYFFPAVDTEQDEQLKRELKLQDGLCDQIARCHSTLGRALSHRRVHEKIVYEGWTCAMIFEDHAKLAKNFSARLAEVASNHRPRDPTTLTIFAHIPCQETCWTTRRDSFPGFDVIQLGRCERPNSRTTPPADQSSVPILSSGWPGKCLHAYVASIHGAVLLSQANRPLTVPPEALLSHHPDPKRARPHVDRAPTHQSASYWYTEPALAWQSV